MASKVLRFEVFKRDSFKCQYCGRTPPEVVLEVDHIIPRVEGGKDDINNYITACFDCNRGKGKRKLEQSSSSLDSHFKEIKEKRDQMKQYSRFLQKLEDEREQSITNLNQTFENFYHGLYFSDRFSNGSLKTFLKYLPETKIKDAIALAAEHFPETNKDEANKAISYFCGICWNWIKKPETRDW